MGIITAIVCRLWMMSIQACALILIVLAVRIFLKKFPKSYSYFLWALVGVRLLCPVFIEASFSLQPEIWDFSGAMQQPDNTNPSDAAQMLENQENAVLGSQDGSSVPGKESDHLTGMLDESQKEKGRPGKPMSDTYVAAQAAGIGMQPGVSVATPPYGSTDGQAGRLNTGVFQNPKDTQKAEIAQKTEAAQNAENPENPVNPENAENLENAVNPKNPREKKADTPIHSILVILYLAGVAATLCVYFVQYLLVRHRIRMAVREEGNVWLCEKIQTPFVLGMARPRIILPFTLQKEEKIYILKHEKIHIKHHDPMFRFFGILCICLHWWNPFVWLAVYRMNQDMEMYCDEAVLRGATAEEKKSYARTLLSFAQKQSGLAIGLAFGESNTERRVKNIMYKRKGSIIIIGIVVLLSVFCIATLMTIPGSADGKENFSGIGQGQNAPENGTADKQEPPEGNEPEGIPNQPEGNGSEGMLNQPEGNETKGMPNQPEDTESMPNRPEGTESMPNQPEGTEGTQIQPEENGTEGTQTHPEEGSIKKNNAANDGEGRDAYLYTENLAFEPYGEVIFAVSAPNPEAGAYADMAFQLLQEGEEVYTFLPNGKEIREDKWEFQRISEVELQDINQDNIPDLITIAEYRWENTEWSEACIYTGTDDGKFIEEIYLEEAYNQSYKKKSLSELLSFIKENADYFIYTSLYGNWSITEYIHPETFGNAGKRGTLSEKEIQSLVGMQLEYGRYYYTLGQQTHLVENYHKELVTAREFDERMGVTTEELGLAATALNYYKLGGVANTPFGSQFYQIDAENALIYHQGAFFRAARKAEATRNIQPIGNADDIKKQEAADQENQPAENFLSTREQTISAYIAALEELYENQILPNGERRDLWDSDSIENNRFALYDVDSDGVEELIIQYTTTYVAGQTEAVYHYDPVSGTLQQELLEYPSLSYYSNGTVKANLSHNHGMAASGEHDFWPYQLYRYNPASGLYEHYASVDAWDKNYKEQDWEGNAFPDDLDLDQDGMLYSRTASDALSDKQDWKGALVDGKEYEEWLNSYIGNAEPLSIPYMYLTQENIHALQ